jgi:hypothetical protein
MNWPTFFTSVSSAVTVAILAAFLTPRFQHVFWKKQKLREQRLSVAERFAALHAKVLFNPTSKPELAEFVEEDALLVLVPILFEREDTIAAAYRLKLWRNSHPRQGMSEEDIRYVWAVRVDILTRLFAEVFEIATWRVEERAKKIAVHKG